jgi:hypothetical protein
MLIYTGPSLCGETCPTSNYCQQCGSDDIKSMCVDFLEMKEYHEIDLDEDPCLFPDCGHALTVSSMDGHMSMASHYEQDGNGFPVKICGISEPFSMGGTGVPVCPHCRGSIRSLSRYGRIVRRAMLDEATKKFVTWSREKYVSLVDLLFKEQQKLEKTPTINVVPPSHRDGHFARPGSRFRQLQNVQAITGNDRYNRLIALRNNINAYAKQVRKEEQPFHRVADLVKLANLQQRTTNEFKYEETVIQVKGSLLGMALLLKCDIIIFSDFLELRKGGGLVQPEAKIDLSMHLLDSEALIKLAHSTVYPREEVQGHIYAAQLFGFSCSLCPSKSPQIPGIDGDTGNLDILKEKGLAHLAQAKALIENYPSTAVLRDEINAVESLLNGLTIYRQVTTEELKTIYGAMTSEFRGGGHWYTCQNGHPFTIGECGMPMERARCPECTAPIGGQGHQAAEGVRHAVEIEEIVGGVNRL